MENQPQNQDPLIKDIAHADGPVDAGKAVLKAIEAAAKKALQELQADLKIADLSEIQKLGALAVIQEGLTVALQAAAAGDEFPVKSYMLQLRAFKEAFRLNAEAKRVEFISNVVQIMVAGVFRAAGGKL